MAGYLPNQFQVTGSNRRTDAYGGTLEKWTRFTLEVVKALCDVRGADRVGVKVAPGFTVNDTFDDDPAGTCTHQARYVSPLGLAYLHVGYDSGYGRGTAPPFNPIDLLRPVYAGTLLAVGGFTKATGEAALAAGRADAVVFGRPFISNPDLVDRLRFDASLTPRDVRSSYGGDDHGCTAYPTLGTAG